jgi:mRNA-degrading endonuclease HigB of HigAB toxin-antitoxin module
MGASVNMKTKLDALKEAAEKGNWRKAISIASKFPRLGEYRSAVLDAHTAFNNPGFMMQIGKDIDTCIESGKSALIAAYRLK